MWGVETWHIIKLDKSIESNIELGMTSFDGSMTSYLIRIKFDHFLFCFNPNRTGCHPLGFLNAAPKRLKQLNWNLAAFFKYVLVNFWKLKVGNRAFLVARFERIWEEEVACKNEQNHFSMVTKNYNCFHFWMKQPFHLKSSVNINGYHSNLKMLICVTWLIDDVIRVISKNQKEKSELWWFLSMFSAIYWYSITKTGKYVKELC